MTFVAILMKKKKQASLDLTWSSMFYDLYMRNVMELTDDLGDSIGFLRNDSSESKFLAMWIYGVRTSWGFLIKHFIPPIIIVLFSLGADSGQFWSYGGYPKRPYQVLGVLVVVFAGFLFVSSLAFPRMYDCLQMSEESSSFRTSKESGELSVKKVANSSDIEDPEQTVEALDGTGEKEEVKPGGSADGEEIAA